MPLGRVADYELLESLGQGGMGVVFKARHSRLDKVVALKILPEELTSSPEHRARFLREARAEAGLSHSAIATCFDVGEAPLEPPDLLDPGSAGPHPERVLFLSMEYVPGSDLLALIGDRPLPIDRVLDLAIQIAEGLESAHAAGVVHRDLKPTNVRVTPDGHVKILDFGLARVLPAVSGSGSRTPSVVTSEGVIIGTAQYMAPEQAHGLPADARSDLFSLGVILYQLVTGKLPFTGRTHLEVLYAVDNEDPPPLARYASGVPDELERIVRKLMEKRPERRYQSAHEARTDLEELRESLGPRKRSRRPAPSRAWAVAAAAALVGVAAWWAWTQWGPRPHPAIAVRPFLNRTGDPRLDYLGEGLASDIIGILVRNSVLNVASYASAASLAAQDRDAQAIARELGVHAVLEGSLRRMGPATVLDVTLVDGRKGFVIWTDRFDYSLEEAMDVERAVASRVAQRLTGRATRGAAGARAAPRSVSAYALYLRAGDYLEDADDPSGPDEALQLYQRALDADPEFALAWAGRSRALWRIYNRDKTAESLRLAEEAADRAVRLDPELLEARLARAQIYRATSRYVASVNELEAILRVNPNWDEAIVQLAATYRESGDLAKAEASLRRAVELRPAYWRNWNQLGALLVRRGDYAGARAAFQEVIRLVPDKNRGYEQLAAVQELEGDYAGAVDTYEKLPAPVQDGVVATNMGTAYFYQRRLPEAERYYTLATQLVPRDPVYRLNLGDLHTRAQRPDSARVQYLEAVRLAEDQLHVDPSDAILKLERALGLAKAGECARAETALRDASSSLPTDDAQAVHEIARAEAVCGHRARALEALKRAVALGFSVKVIRLEDEFRELSSDPGFIALTSAEKH